MCIVFWKFWYHHSTVESEYEKSRRTWGNSETEILINLRLERATWQGNSKVLPEERSRPGFHVKGSRKHGFSWSIANVKFVHHVSGVAAAAATDDDDDNEKKI